MHHLLQQQHISHLGQNTPILSLWRCHCLSDGNLHITTNVPKSFMPWKFDKVEGMLVEKRLLYVYTCLFFVLFLYIYCGDSWQLSISAVYAWNPRHSLMQIKATISLENREKWRVLNQPAGLRWAFLFCKHDFCNFYVPIISHYFYSLFFIKIYYSQPKQKH